MLRRLLSFGIRSYVGGPAKSWVFTSGLALLMGMISKATSKTEVIDLSSTKPGDRILIEHLDITHKQQIKDQKRTKKSDKVLLKNAKRQKKAAKKLARRS